jgi:hypothetical protein
VAYSVATDENTDITDYVQFAGFIPDVNKEFQLMEDLLEWNKWKCWWIFFPNGNPFKKFRAVVGGKIVGVC